MEQETKTGLSLGWVNYVGLWWVYPITHRFFLRGAIGPGVYLLS